MEHSKPLPWSCCHKGVVFTAVEEEEEKDFVPPASRQQGQQPTSESVEDKRAGVQASESNTSGNARHNSTTKTSVQGLQSSVPPTGALPTALCTPAR